MNRPDGDHAHTTQANLNLANMPINMGVSEMINSSGMGPHGQMAHPHPADQFMNSENHGMHLKSEPHVNMPECEGKELNAHNNSGSKLS